MRKIVFTGGGSAGHVVPNIALIEELKERYDLYYIGTDGIEKRLIAPLSIPFGQIECPRFVRGFAAENFLIPFRLRQAVKAAETLLKKIRPDVVFSKGGYVALPVVTAAKKLSIPALTHESDLSMGLANRLMAGMCRYVLTSFERTAEEAAKGKYVGPPLRKELFSVSNAAARAKYGFSSYKKVLLLLGGGSGSRELNELLRENLFSLCKKYYVLHLCGRGNRVESNVAGYIQKEFESDMGAAYAAADGVVARAGSNTLFETLALKKPALFVPLQNRRSRGDQVKNAEYFEKRGLCRVWTKKSGTDFLFAVEEMMEDRELKKNIAACDVASGNEKIVECIEECMEK